MDPHRLRILRAVIAAGSVREAATALGYTPSAISQHLTTLQRDTGLALLERQGRGLRPTPVGLALAERADDVLAQLDALEDFAGALRTGTAQSIVLGYPSSATAAWIPAIAATFRREFPDTQLSLRLTDLAPDRPFTPDVEIYVDGAASGPLVGYAVELLRQEPYVLLLPPGHALSSRDTVSIRDLRDLLWIETDPSPCNRAPAEAFAAAGFSPRVTVVAPDYPAGAAFVAHGLGVTMVPEVAAKHLPPDCTAISLVDPEPTRRVMLRTRCASVTPTVRALAEIIRQAVRS